MKLAGVNLNLLVVLDALLTEQSVTAAARRVGLSQSATSHALARLREQLGDPLLLRSPEGTILSARAVELAEPVRAVLHASERIFLPHEDFAPRSVSAEFRIGMHEAAQSTILPKLFERLQREAPGISIAAPPYSRDSLARDLRQGTFDFTISTPIRDSAKVHCELLATDNHVSIVRKDHPEVPKRLTLKRFLSLKHIAIARSDLVDPELDSALLRLRERRTVALTVASHSPIPQLVARTDLVATLPSMLLDSVDESSPITLHRPPIELDPIPISLFWHERTHFSPAHGWMRGVIRDTVESLGR